VELQLFEDRSKSILSKNTSPDLPFTWSVNPYRGCMHACAYCYARPTHEYLDFGAGTDFDRKITFKTAANQLLSKAFMKPSWQGDLVLFSGNTDPYQPLEDTYRLTRACLQVCAEFQNPVAVITKSALVERDIDLLSNLARNAECFVTLSIPFFDPDKARRVEPFAPTPARRFKALSRLAQAGIPVGVNVAPIIPGLNDEDIPRILEAAAAAGARQAGRILVRLPGPVKEIFQERMESAFPLRHEKILARIREARDGALSDANFGARMSGKGHYWKAIQDLFDSTCARLGLNSREEELAELGKKATFRRPGEQLLLF